MPPAAEPDPSLVLHQIADLVRGPRPDFDGARKILAEISASQPELQAQAEQLIRMFEAAQAPGGWGQRLTAAVSRLVPGSWGPFLGVVAVGAGLLGYYFLGGGGDSRPAAALSYPLPCPLFEPAGDGRLITFQHGGLVECAVQPAPKDLNLGAALSTWPRAGRFRTAWAAPYDGQRFVEGGLLMDADALFVGAHVGDPWPLRSAHKPGADPDGGWAGGSLQLRLGTDVTADKDGWPVTPDYPADRLLHLTLWHSEGRACLHLAEGAGVVRLRKILFPNDDGYDGRFEPDGDGLGYAIKCRVPWRVLGLEKAPYGRKLGLCWEVSWSDRAGKDCVGKLTEFFDANTLRQLDGITPEGERLPGKQSYQRPVIWGRATCPPPP
jgi:hypothetical protein